MSGKFYKITMPGVNFLVRRTSLGIPDFDAHLRKHLLIEEGVI